ncbi:hypothetical protein RIF29_15034 [Crotalaria pallida]|uniref:Armadillo repeat-containing protein 6 n=1 Tax=Crotalaria pallida TaxID=3830 RepID=A0AAN9FEW9_CROPI
MVMARLPGHPIQATQSVFLTQIVYAIASNVVPPSLSFQHHRCNHHKPNPISRQQPTTLPLKAFTLNQSQIQPHLLRPHCSLSPPANRQTEGLVDYNSAFSVLCLYLFYSSLDLLFSPFIMAPPPKTMTARTISQEAFDELVKENIEDLGMDPTEALQDAIQTLTLQGVDLSGIVTCVPGEGNVRDNPVIQSLERLKQLDSKSRDLFCGEVLDEVAELFNKLSELCAAQGSGNVNVNVNANAAVATKNGAVELACSLCSKIPSGSVVAIVSSLKAMTSLLHDLQSTGTFHNSNGPGIVIGFLNDNKQNLDVLNSGFRVVASAATGNEIVKESFMELKVDELIMEIMTLNKNLGIQSLYDAIRVLLTPDDNRVVASQVYGYARKFAKIGIAEALVDSLRAGLGSPDLVSASVTLKAIAVNDEICKSIAEKGGIDAILRCIEDSGEQGNKAVAKVCCSLLSKLAGSDTNKSAVVEKGGMDKLIKLSARFADDPSVLQEIMAIISVLSLRSPENAARAIEAGAGDLAIQAMQKFPAAHQMQRNSCLMIRNLVVRNPENRAILLNNGAEKYIRKAKQTHGNCKNAATDALRDLGVDGYHL